MIRPKLLTVSGDTDIYIGEKEYITGGGTFTFKVPQTVTRIHVCCIGAGAQGAYDGNIGNLNEWAGGGAGGLGWANNIEVEPDEILKVQVGAIVDHYGNKDPRMGDSWIKRTNEAGEAIGDPIVAGNATPGNYGSGYQYGGDFIGDGGGNGGNGSGYIVLGGYVGPNGSGGGAGGYTGDGSGGTTLGPGAPGQGGAGSGGASQTRSGIGGTKGYRGGGTGIYGEGASGPAARTDSSEWVDQGGGYDDYPGRAGNPGSGGDKGNFGAGGAMPKDGWDGRADSKAGHGAVRIIWGNRFSYPDNADLTAE